jgi:hypothetical protein
MTTKVKWSEEDNKICSESYLNGLNPRETKALLPHISLNSIRYKYHNCKYLEHEEKIKAGEKVKGTLEHASEVHRKVWNQLISDRNQK